MSEDGVLAEYLRGIYARVLIENGIMRPPRRAMGPAGTVDGTIGRFLLPIGGGALLRLPGSFIF